MKKILLPITFIIVNFLSFSQDKAPLVTDRPDQTEAPTVIPKGSLQIETGAVFEKQDEFQNNVTYNTTLIKYGLFERMELRFINEFEGTYFKLGNTTTKTSGILPIYLGTKINILKEDEKGLEFSLISHLHFNTGRKKYNTSYIMPAFRFTLAKKINDKMNFSVNAGGEWDGDNPNFTGIYTASLGIGLTDKMACFVETYGFLTQGNYDFITEKRDKTMHDHRLDAGVTYLLNPVVQYDISGGVGLSKGSPDYFISTGLSVRLFK